MDAYGFGYPKRCNRCESILDGEMKLPPPYHSPGTTNQKIMLIGQDPYIYRDPARVKCVLMLDEDNGQLKRWLGAVLGDDAFLTAELYATNIVKCPVSRDSGLSLKRVSSLLALCFHNCRAYLIDEITQFTPTLALTFGGPAHRLFRTIIDNGEALKDSMQDAFTGEFVEVNVVDVRFYYSPCLHIKTFRVAETYGGSIENFKLNLRRRLTGLNNG